MQQIFEEAPRSSANLSAKSEGRGIVREIEESSRENMTYPLSKFSI